MQKSVYERLISHKFKFIMSEDWSEKYQPTTEVRYSTPLLL